MSKSSELLVFRGRVGLKKDNNVVMKKKPTNISKLGMAVLLKAVNVPKDNFEVGDVRGREAVGPTGTIAIGAPGTTMPFGGLSSALRARERGSVRDIQLGFLRARRGVFANSGRKVGAVRVDKEVMILLGLTASRFPSPFFRPSAIVPWGIPGDRVG